MEKTDPTDAQHMPAHQPRSSVERHHTPHGETAYSPASILRALTQDPLSVAPLRETEPNHPRESMKKSTGNTVILTIVSLLLGVTVGGGVVHLRAAAIDGAEARQGLFHQVEERRGEIDSLSAAAAAKRDEVQVAQTAIAEAGGVGPDLIESTARQAGSTSLQGPGLVIEVMDSAPFAPAPGEEASRINRVTDNDLQEVTNALWAAGAEAIAINGHRISNTTAIRTAGEAILVDLRPVSPPYRVEAIGAPGELASAYESTPSAQRVVATASRYGLRITQAEQEVLTLPAATGELRYAKIAVPQTDAAENATPMNDPEGERP